MAASDRQPTGNVFKWILDEAERVRTERAEHDTKIKAAPRNALRAMLEYDAKIDAEDAQRLEQLRGKYGRKNSSATKRVA